MTKAKRAVQLTGAIISIVIGAITIISSIYLMAIVGDMLAGAGAGAEEMVGMFYAATIISMLFAIAMIVCGSLMCPNPSKKNTEYKGLTITMLVLNAFLLLCAILNYTDTTSIVEILVCLANVGLFIAALCIKSEPTQAQPVTEPATANQTTVAQQPVEEKSETQSTGNKKIDAIRKLQADGVISEDEMKSLIIKELEK